MPDGGQAPGDGSPAAANALALLYREQAPRLRRRLRSRLGSSEEASDIVHDAFAKLLRSRIETLRDPAAFLNRIVRNLLIDRSRRNAVRPQHVAIGGELEIAVRAGQADEIELDELRSRYRELVDKLPPRTREVFTLHRNDELAYAEIAARLGISIRTVEWHVAEAIIRLGKGLEAR